MEGETVSRAECRPCFYSPNTNQGVMNPITTFVLSTNFSLLLLYPHASMVEIVFFNLCFAALLEVDKVLAYRLYRPRDSLRTWAREPAGFIALGLPLGMVMATIEPYYLHLTLLPYGAHILLDYISPVKLRPLAPFSDFVLQRTGMTFTDWPRPDWQDEERGLSEVYFLAITLLALAYIWANLV
jgi:hypothetical protein